jgi:hypothetical protein
MSANAELLLTITGLALFAVLFWMQQRRHRNQLREQRASMWQECLSLLQSPELIQDDIDFPLLQGHYRNYPVTLEPLADHVGYRKLPQLWLRATVKTTLPVAGVLDLLLRPENTEFYSPAWSLPISMPLPGSWPVHAMLRADCDEVAATIPALDAHLDMFSDPRMKELLISPRGIRCVLQLAQGERADYSVLRRVRFGDALRVPAHRLRDLLDNQLSLIETLRNAPTPVQTIVSSGA